MTQMAHKRLFSRDAIVLAVLLMAAVLSWDSLYRQAMDGMAGSVTMGLAFGPFLAMWIVMMVAMMFPTAAPMILTFGKIQSRREASGSFWATWLFVAGYLLLWSLTGIVAYGLARGAEALAEHFVLSPDLSARIGGALLVAAGVYQLTPLKNLCLSKCRTPVTFIMASWRPGAKGAFAMGLLHGLYCFGCCWLLFAILFPLGIMNIAVMATVTLLVFAEKALPWGRWVAIGSAVLLVVYGSSVIAMPSLLPTYAKPGATDMNGMDMSKP